MKKIIISILLLIFSLGIGYQFLDLDIFHQVTAEDLRLKGKVIVLDPGHGGGDHGAQGKAHGTIEKDLNLKVAMNIKKELEKRTDAKVILTRDTDASLLPKIDQKKELQARVDVAKKNHANLYVSIHHDAFTDPSVKGITTHYAPLRLEDRKLAKYVQQAIFNQKIDTNDRGVQGSDYLVLRENSIPAILLELGFISNESDEVRMNSKEFQTKSASGIVDGIIQYLSR
ncbi:N-acetylmuramoyl-L-alanine amidase [Thermoactinomyces sp. DSM 45892]|uniref:N-acetylmuramoyl-L-alanine amidase family protein n=1 Tax=Thermoactinomyces sp. DSM 45892 TaxID=1882753 RepID=UPI000897D128|nr:N-acetylmuramoyl-L-alanine amidase [Thermoactinomyces sp. DSM 45892]SDY53352.1 N-acetylmuramoyl-L-alanine amidase [Thermoactinomyces sp. DSM 45892]